MIFKPNYGQERSERNRAARVRQDEKQRKRDEKTTQRKAEREAADKPASEPGD
jgi:hypothetical protein